MVATSADPTIGFRYSIDGESGELAIMRTALFLLAGFLLLAVFLILGRLFASNYPAAMTTATVAYIALWLAIAAFNLWTGVAKAGYSAREELPVFALIFLVPSIVALACRRIL
jgi:hypothetical protein